MSACVVTVSYRTGPALAECLAALSRVRAVDEIVLVDNGDAPSEAALLDAFAASDPRARLLRGHGNVGFGAACNLGAGRARSDVLVFANPDVVLAPDAVERMSAIVQHAPVPTLLGGDLRDAAGAPERGGRRDRLTLWRAFVSLSGMSRLEAVAPVLRDYDRRQDPLPRTISPVGAVSGALMAVRRADFFALGGFDEGYFLHVEEMGSPVSILQLGRNLIRDSGREIDVVFTGLRPGEKLSEQLVDEYELAEATALQGVFRVTTKADDAFVTSADVAHLETIARNVGTAAVRQRVFAHLDQRLRREELAAG